MTWKYDLMYWLGMISEQEHRVLKARAQFGAEWETEFARRPEYWGEEWYAEVTVQYISWQTILLGVLIFFFLLVVLR